MGADADGAGADNERVVGDGLVAPILWAYV